jgi:hypothetical protein
MLLLYIKEGRLVGHYKKKIMSASARPLKAKKTKSVLRILLKARNALK